MKYTFLVLFLLSFELHANYEKKIILASFKSSKEANKALTHSFVKIKTYNQVKKLEKKHNFKVHTRASGKYVVLVVEPFYEKQVLKQVLKLLKPYYKHAYYNNYTPPKKEKDQKSIQDKIDQKNSTKVVEKKLKQKLEKSKKIITKKEIKPQVIKESIDVPKKAYTKPQNEELKLTNSYVPIHQENTSQGFKWFYIVFFIFIAVVFRYIIKYRKMYEEF